MWDLLRLRYFAGMEGGGEVDGGSAVMYITVGRFEGSTVEIAVFAAFRIELVGLVGSGAMGVAVAELAGGLGVQMVLEGFARGAACRGIKFMS